MRSFYLVAFLIFTSSFAQAADKVALLIGNSNYESVPLLYNPVNDVRLIDEALRSHGFDVTRVEDQSLAALNRSLRKFQRKADVAEIAMIYYAGHGIEIGGVNYLIPVDAELEDERDTPGEAVSVASILKQISGAKKLKLMVLDACRDNPFADRIIRSNRGRNVGRGLARTTAAASDTMIAYAAAAGSITLDGPRGGNSPFTAAFAEALGGPARDVRLLFGSVRDIMRSEAPDAEPFVYTSLGGSNYLIQEQRASQASSSQDYQRAERIGTSAAWKAFLAKHRAGGGLHVALAEAALAKNEGSSGTAVSGTVGDAGKSGSENDGSENAKVSRLITAAEAGSSSAMARLGWLYLKGEGVVQNGATAVEWYIKAAELGHANAMRNLSIIYRQGDIVPRNRQAAISWGIKAVDADEVEANFTLALAYYEGADGEGDLDSAFHYFHLGAEQGDADAMHMLAVMYDEVGKVKSRQQRVANQSRAGEWLLAALDSNNRFTLDQLNNNAGAYSVVARKAIQSRLRDEGFYNNEIDGSFGPITKNALNDYFNAHKAAPTQE